jgi:hypothetical protein
LKVDDKTPSFKPHSIDHSLCDPENRSSLGAYPSTANNFGKAINRLSEKKPNFCLFRRHEKFCHWR